MHERTPITRYGGAVAFTLAALVMRLAIQPLVGRRIGFATFLGAVTCTSVFGGFGPAVVAALAGSVGGLYFLVRSFPSPSAISPDDLYAMGSYLAVSAIVIASTEMQRRASARAMAAAQLAAERSVQLESEMAQRQRAEEAEELAGQRYQVTLASIGDGVIAADTEARIAFINPAAAAMAGWPEAEAVGKPVETVFNILHEQTGASMENPVSRAMREAMVIGPGNHTVLLSRDGRRIPIDESAAPILDPASRVLGAVLIFRNVTEARARQAELLGRQRLFEHARDAIIIVDAGRRIKGWNSGARDLYGWTEQEVLGRVVEELLQTRGAESLADIGEQLLLKGSWDGELIHTCRDGRVVVSESRHVLLRGPRGDVTGMLEINRDVTERKRAEDELRRTAALAEEGHSTLEALLEHIPEGIAIADAPDLRLRAVSRHGIEMAGLEPGVPGQARTGVHPPFPAFFHADGNTPASVQELPLTRAVTRGETVTGEEWLIRRPDGTAIPVLCNAAPIRDARGAITGGLLAWRDISRRKRLEEKLIETAKLESLGVLAGGIAHDFNNLLTGVMGNASLLVEELPPASNSRTWAESIVRAAERAAKLTAQMLAYSGRGRFVVQPIDLSRFVRDMAALIHASIPKHVEFRLELQDDLPLLEADTAQLQQVVMNLIVNGAEAIGPEGGKLKVSTRTERMDEAFIQQLAGSDGLRPGTFLVLNVEDTGCGMDDATRARMFDPFFTTKFTGRGLGLAAVQGIIRGHRGAIKVDSVPGQGTRFQVLLPASTARPGTVQPATGLPADTARFRAVQPAAVPPAAIAVHGNAGPVAEPPAPRPQPVTILVVDDEELVRSIARAGLEKLGYLVLEASDGLEAVTVFRDASEIRLVVLDMTMPGISTDETLQGLRRVRDDVPILLSSGFSEVEARRRFAGRRLAGFLQKPYTIHALAERVTAAAELCPPSSSVR